MSEGYEVPLSYRGDRPKCRWFTGTVLSIGFMAVSAVDLLYVFGKSLVMSDQVILYFSSVRELTMVFSIVCSTEEGSSAMI